MGFSTALALLVGLLVVAPLLAHLLRRRRVDVRDFPPARMVLAAQPVARQRAHLEDRLLFAIRAAAVLALAVMGASPFVSCSRLSVGRKDGGAVAVVLVVDDSLSMQARQGDTTRFSVAIEGARQTLSSLREGDSAAVLAAGSPPRVVLAATSNLDAARAALEAMQPSDRGTDLDGALALAASIARSLPHADRRVVLLSDMADGSGRPEPPGASLDVPVWAPLDELRGRVPDCAVLRSVRRGVQVVTSIRCGDEGDARGRSLQLLLDERVVAQSTLEPGKSHEVTLTIPDPKQAPRVARLTGADAIASDDQAPVTAAAAALQVAVVSDLSGPSSGVPSPLEQALWALDEAVAVRPLPVVPDDPDALSAYTAVILDDPPGLTPEARTAFRAWLSRGGVGVLWLGPRAGGAILGAAFDPFVSGSVRWSAEAPGGADATSAAALGEVGQGLMALAPRGRATLDDRAASGATALARWSDGKPLIFQRAEGRGEVVVVTLPASAEQSDLPLRPAFLELLSRVLDASRARQEGKRSTAGQPWVFKEPVPGEVAGAAGPLPLREAGGVLQATPGKAGLYTLRFGEAVERRVVEIDEREVDTRPRGAASAGAGGALGSQKMRLDVSPQVAWVLLLATAAEAAVRLSKRRREAPGPAPAAGG